VPSGRSRTLAGRESFDNAEFEPVVCVDREADGLERVECAPQVVLVAARRGDNCEERVVDRRLRPAKRTAEVVTDQVRRSPCAFGFGTGTMTFALTTNQACESVGAAGDCDTDADADHGQSAGRADRG
jgi:hypothetical protein